jgi:hypothetical protein
MQVEMDLSKAKVVAMEHNGEQNVSLAIQGCFAMLVLLILSNLIILTPNVKLARTNLLTHTILQLHSQMRTVIMSVIQISHLLRITHYV